MLYLCVNESNEILLKCSLFLVYWLFDTCYIIRLEIEKFFYIVRYPLYVGHEKPFKCKHIRLVIIETVTSH